MGKRAFVRRVRRSRRVRSPAPLVLAGLVLAGAIVGGGAAIASWRGGGAGADTGGSAVATPETSPATPAASASTDPKAPDSEDSDPEDSAPAKAPSPSASPRVPDSGPGTFTTAQANGKKTGSGPLRRYSVQVEDGIDLSAAGAAAEIQEILAHPRGWAAHGRGSFQLVSEGKGADFVIRIATPTTADKLCLAQGLDTHGELNCETTEGVVVNLRRWVQGSPTFDGPPSEYRHLIINHEVGHEIGIRQHMGCGGPGRLAPVMMQQIKGLDGCRSNAWPYEEDGTYIEGPLI
ncbi:DUF3152 domain-containing protein [Streptomyces sp. NBC_01429]|uniref:DUF3152 domain-containing protein n=1 Tax=Streptomyces sp. NBC_01429 TaxID=2903862 RepID=UPI002E2A2E9B|nr:DUF3152 domain-containing protein [Streptomyces sp. NBC_01429]